MENLGDVANLLRACYGAMDMTPIRTEDASGTVQRRFGRLNDGMQSGGRLVAKITSTAVITDRARRKVLLVDDELPVRAFVAKVLEREGFEITEAADGVDALGLLHQMRGAVDVLVTDVKMPRMTGIELVENVRTEFAAVPVVFISGEPLKDRLHNPSRRVIFLQKPFLPQAMLDAIRAVMTDGEALRGLGA